jgi:hypothetical protein
VDQHLGGKSPRTWSAGVALTMKKRLFLLTVLLLALALPSLAAAQGTITVLDQQVEAVFRDHITFHINVESDSPINQVRLYYRVTGLPATSRGEAEFTPGKKVEASFKIDQKRDYLPPGSDLKYWWKITTEAGDTLKTDPQPYLYMDDRHKWKTLSNDRLTLYWYDGDQDFGDALFQQANKTLDQIENEAGVRVETPVRIFIYASHEDLLNAIEVGAQEWTGGQAFTDHGVVVMDVSPFNLDFGLIATPHELTHIVIHRATDNPFGDLPRWLDEGLATYMSGELNASWRGYRELVARRAEQGKLMTLQTLSSNFPADPDLAGQAYAQSGLMVEFIIKHYGKEAMAKLLKIFAQGSTYDDALREALGVDTWGLDNAWRKSIGAPAIEKPTTLSGTPAAEKTATPGTPVPVAGPTPTNVALLTPRSVTFDLGNLPCLGAGLVGVAILTLFILYSRTRGT